MDPKNLSRHHPLLNHLKKRNFREPHRENDDYVMENENIFFTCECLRFSISDETREDNAHSFCLLITNVCLRKTRCLSIEMLFVNLNFCARSLSL